MSVLEPIWLLLVILATGGALACFAVQVLSERVDPDDLRLLWATLALLGVALVLGLSGSVMFS